MIPYDRFAVGSALAAVVPLSSSEIKEIDGAVVDRLRLVLYEVTFVDSDDTVI